MKMRTALGIPFIVLMLAACGGAVSDDPTTSSPNGSTSTTTDATTTTTTSPDSTTPSEADMPDTESVAEEAISNLATRLRTSADEIEVVRSEEVEWPDASLDCAEEGRVYAQVVTPGFQVILQTDGRVYDYHADSDGDVFLCPSDEDAGGYDFVPPPGFDE